MLEEILPILEIGLIFLLLYEGVIWLLAYLGRQKEEEKSEEK